MLWPAAIHTFEKAGLRTSYHVFASAPTQVLLDPSNSPDSAMVRIAGGEFRAFLVGSDGSPPLELKGYQMDRFEVSNREYKRFVDAGGYRDQRYWDEPIRDGRRTLTLADAAARFVDKTGRPGPASWEGGDFPTGQGDLPVGGVSWYEAAAYAKFAGKSLPTIYHWAQAAAVYRARFVVPFSNLEGSGPLPVGILRGDAALLEDPAGELVALAGGHRKRIFREQAPVLLLAIEASEQLFEWMEQIEHHKKVEVFSIRDRRVVLQLTHAGENRISVEQAIKFPLMQLEFHASNVPGEVIFLRNGFALMASGAIHSEGVASYEMNFNRTVQNPR